MKRKWSRYPNPLIRRNVEKSESQSMHRLRHSGWRIGSSIFIWFKGSSYWLTRCRSDTFDPSCPTLGLTHLVEDRNKLVVPIPARPAGAGVDWDWRSLSRQIKVIRSQRSPAHMAKCSLQRSECKDKKKWAGLRKSILKQISNVAWK